MYRFLSFLLLGLLPRAKSAAGSCSLAFSVDHLLTTFTKQNKYCRYSFSFFSVLLMFCPVNVPKKALCVFGTGSQPHDTPRKSLLFPAFFGFSRCFQALSYILDIKVIPYLNIPYPLPLFIF